MKTVLGRGLSSGTLMKSIHNDAQLKIDIFVQSEAVFEMPVFQYPHVGQHHDIVGH